VEVGEEGEAAVESEIGFEDGLAVGIFLTAAAFLGGIVAVAVGNEAYPAMSGGAVGAVEPPGEVGQDVMEEGLAEIGPAGMREGHGKT